MEAMKDCGATYWYRLIGVPFWQGYVEALQVKTRVVMAGNGPPILFLHGIASTLEAHLNLLPCLLQDYRLVLYDMPGRGFSDFPDHPYTIDYLAQHLVALQEALALGPALWVGQSLGGWVAAWAAAHYPGKALGLVLNNPGNVKSRPEALERLRTSNLNLARNPTREEIRSRMSWLFHRQECLREEDVAIRYLAYSRPGFARAMEHISAMLVPEVRARYLWRPEWLSRIDVPALLIWSRGNPLATREDMAELASWFPRGRLVELGASGEFPQVEEEDAFVALLQKFCQEAFGIGFDPS